MPNPENEAEENPDDYGFHETLRRLSRLFEIWAPERNTKAIQLMRTYLPNPSYNRLYRKNDDPYKSLFKGQEFTEHLYDRIVGDSINIVGNKSHPKHDVFSNLLTQIGVYAKGKTKTNFIYRDLPRENIDNIRIRNQFLGHDNSTLKDFESYEDLSMKIKFKIDNLRESGKHLYSIIKAQEILFSICFDYKYHNFSNILRQMLICRTAEVGAYAANSIDLIEYIWWFREFLTVLESEIGNDPYILAAKTTTSTYILEIDSRKKHIEYPKGARYGLISYNILHNNKNNSIFSLDSIGARAASSAINEALWSDYTFGNNFLGIPDETALKKQRDNYGDNLETKIRSYIVESKLLFKSGMIDMAEKSINESLYYLNKGCIITPSHIIEIYIVLAGIEYYYDNVQLGDLFLQKARDVCLEIYNNTSKIDKEISVLNDPPPSKWSIPMYVYGQQGRTIRCRESVINRKRSSPSCVRSTC